MDFTFSAEEEAYRAEVRAWLAENRPDWSGGGSEYDADDDFERHRAWHQKLYDVGYVGASWPVDGALEPCPMCIARLLITGVETVKFLALDELGGMATRLHQLPTAWERLGERVEFVLADVSDELRQFALDAFLLNLERLRNKLYSR